MPFDQQTSQSACVAIFIESIYVFPARNQNDMQGLSHQGFSDCSNQIPGKLEAIQSSVAIGTSSKPANPSQQPGGFPTVAILGGSKLGKWKRDAMRTLLQSSSRGSLRECPCIHYLVQFWESDSVICWHTGGCVSAWPPYEARKEADGAWAVKMPLPHFSHFLIALSDQSRWLKITDYPLCPSSKNNEMNRHTFTNWDFPWMLCILTEETWERASLYIALQTYKTTWKFTASRTPGNHLSTPSLYWRGNWSPDRGRDLLIVLMELVEDNPSSSICGSIIPWNIFLL